MSHTWRSRSCTIALWILAGGSMFGCGLEPAETGASDGLDRDGDGYLATRDCDDLDASVHPGAVELCDGVDQDCDGEVDEGGLVEDDWYLDEDGDGAVIILSEGDCAPEAPIDCDDADPDVHPAAAEVCNGWDDDCDRRVDEADEDWVEASGTEYFVDEDGDGWGTDSVWRCEHSDPLAHDPGDCDDSLASVKPWAEELCDYLDNDCDGTVDPDGICAWTWVPDLVAATWYGPDERGALGYSAGIHGTGTTRGPRI